MDFSKLESHLSDLDKLEFRTPTRPFVPLLFPIQIAGARLRTGQHDLAITCFAPYQSLGMPSSDVPTR
jgi:hypothetical protein